MSHPSSPPPPLRVGIVGTGGISRAHLPGWLALDAELHCTSHEGAEAFAAESGARVHSTLEELLAAVDVVDVCTPTPEHPAIVRAALAAGKDVICEKPLALDPAEARELADLAAREGRRLLPAHVVRFFPQYAAAKRAVEAGTIGSLAVLRFERTGSLPDRDWYADDSLSGGIVMDQMIHDIDQALWLAGPVRTVHAQQARAGSDATIRTGHVMLTHRSGALSHCRGFWGPPGTGFRYTLDLAGDAGRLRYDSAGDPGVIFDEVAAARQAGADGFLPDVSGMPDPYAAEIAEFMTEIGGGPAARVDAADGVRAVEVAAAALESLRTGRSIAC
ncbi:Gfo/Idh/MocA family protein [Brachybacterium saurashtrense]|uniref:Gfo/Idh/MocA family oxidoreductase n=1 Tax=Brachybacterium saurashtrense TaxID=556288 RepID=A0A345YRW6_9MICO|nr:Gfo/Idh/MocA family oxidoreductase [Brachybacterium saurashtrense]AXK46668.1 gfo/Idh/MocA family oxidoreductase [Brachybacterium saurashtrense]RRR22382.1 gfo/Idh/MocA family oxidoreductase [Brachybacterium saurashtrense]